MKVAVTAEGKDIESPIGPHFARASYYFVVDVDSSAFSLRNNTDLQHTTYLAGTQAAGLLIGRGVRAVIAANIGPKAFATFSAAGVEVFQAPSVSVGEAIQMFQSGQLARLSGPSVEESWPQYSGE